jgi:hypothetical protein
VAYWAGSVVPLTFNVTDTSGTPQNTTPVTLTVTLPDGSTATPAVTNPPAVTGTYTASYTTTQAGHHTVLWTAGGTYPGSYTDAFDTLPTAEGAILSMADAKAMLKIASTDTSQDDLVREFNEAATKVVEWFCGPVIQQTVTEELTAGGLTVALSKPPVIELVAWTSVPAEITDSTRTVPSPASPMFPVMVWGVAYPLTDLHVNGKLAIVRHTSGLPFYYGSYLWQYTAGRAVIPQNILNGTRAIVRHLYEMERGGANPPTAFGADQMTTQTPYGFAVPNRALEMLEPERAGGAIA